MTSESNTRTNEAPIDRDGGDMDDGAAARISASCDIAGEATPPLHIRLLEAGIPVVVCRPHVHYHDCRDDCDLELAPPRGWQKIDADQARRRISAFRPGIDTLAMVGGHGIDVLDIDRKVGASVGMVPAELTVWGLSITPSGGWHFPVPSTGYGKGDLIIAGRHVGDYVGGTLAGGGRLLCFLPGSSRPRYPRGGYLEAVRWDIDRLLDDTVPDLLVGILDAAGLSRSATPGKQAVSRAEVVRFLENHREQLACAYGAAALYGIVAQVDDIVPGNAQRGRHAWAVRSTLRVVELIRAGCLGSDAHDVLAANMTRIKPRSAAELDAIMAHAIANTTAKTRCEVHGA